MKNIHRFIPPLLMALIFFVMLGAYVTLMFKTETLQTAKVVRAVWRNELSGDIEYLASKQSQLIVTDKGLYLIQADGMFASKDFGKLERGKTYRIRARGLTNTYMGVYPYIIEAEEINEAQVEE